MLFEDYLGNLRIFQTALLQGITNTVTCLF